MANKINYSETSIILEISQSSRVNGVNNIQFLHFIDDINKLTPEGSLFIHQLFNRWKKEESVILPKNYYDWSGYRNFEKNFIQTLASISPRSKRCANLFYQITCDCKASTDPNDAYVEHQPFVLSSNHKGMYFIPSYEARNLMGIILRGKDWVKSEYRLGTLTIDDINKDKQRGVRPASISSEGVQFPYETHHIKTTAEGYTAHDRSHQMTGAHIPTNVKKALNRMIFLTRTISGIKWSKAIWAIVDDAYANTYMEFYNKKNSEIFYILSDRAFSAFTMSDEDCSQIMRWITIMDMVDRPGLWSGVMNIDVNDKKFPYKNEISLYSTLKNENNFHTLDVKQKLYILEKTHGLLLKDDSSNNTILFSRKKPYNYGSAWEIFNKNYIIPDADSLKFMKSKSSNINQIILVDTTKEEINKPTSLKK